MGLGLTGKLGRAWVSTYTATCYYIHVMDSVVKLKPWAFIIQPD